MTIETAALELNRIAVLAYSDRNQALNDLMNLQTPVEISSLRDAVLEHIGRLFKPERKSRSANKKA